MKNSEDLKSNESAKQKKCSTCKKMKDVTEYYKDKTKKDGLSGKCKECSSVGRLKSERENIEVKMLSGARNRAKKKGLYFDLELSDIVIPHRCPCLDLVLKANTGSVKADSPSLDRVDSSKGYTKDNVWVVSYRANTIMNNATPEELRLIASRLDAKLTSIERQKQLELDL